jgi:hypothetical protein
MHSAGGGSKRHRPKVAGRHDAEASGSLTLRAALPRYTAIGHTGRMPRDGPEAEATVPSPQWPAEYLAQVRDAYTRLDRDPEPDQELLDLTKLDLEKRGLDLPDPDEAYEMVVAAISSEIVAACSETWSCDLGERCAIGPLRHPAVNARCFKSPHGVPLREFDLWPTRDACSRLRISGCWA